MNIDGIAANLYPPGYPAWWKAVAYIESHDEVYDQPDRHPRVPTLADPSDHSVVVRVEPVAGGASVWS